MFGLLVIECLLNDGVRGWLDYVILKFQEIHPTLTLEGTCSDMVDINPKRDLKDSCMYQCRKKYEWQLDVGTDPKIDLKQTNFRSLWWRPFVLTSTKSISEDPRYLCLFVFSILQMYMIHVHVIRIKHVLWYRWVNASPLCKNVEVPFHV